MWRSIENPFPASVRRIGIAAPASSPAPREIEAAAKLLKSFGVEPVVGKHVAEACASSYLAADDEARSEDFNAFLRDESIDLILCARGGYGSMRILDAIDWAALKRRRLPVLGYSDITALHLAMLAQNAGVPIVCPMACKLKKALSDAFTAQAMKRALKVALGKGQGGTGTFSPAPLPAGRSFEVIQPGGASGPLVAANLTLLAALCGTKALPSLKGAILAIEDIGEKPRTLDRMLAQLELSGILSQLAGLIFCDFSDCGPENELRLLSKRFGRNVKGPVLWGLPFGHVLPTMSFRMGELAEIRDGRLFFLFLKGQGLT